MKQQEDEEAMKAEENAAEVKAQGTIEKREKLFATIKRRFGRTLIWRDCRTPTGWHAEKCKLWGRQRELRHAVTKVNVEWFTEQYFPANLFPT